METIKALKVLIYSGDRLLNWLKFLFTQPDLDVFECEEVEATLIKVIAKTILANALISNAALDAFQLHIKICRTANLNVTCDVEDNDQAGV